MFKFIHKISFYVYNASESRANKKISNLAKYFIVLFFTCFLVNHDIFVEKKYNTPKFTKGIYLNAYSFNKFKNRIKFLHSVDMNTVVMDSYRLTRRHIMYADLYNIHIISRVTVFPGGLKRWRKRNSLINYAITQCRKMDRIGIREIQLDYIRFADRKTRMKNEEKSEYILNVIRKIKSCARTDILWQADVFGRIPMVSNDRIGQNYDKMDKILDSICPMAYPSYYSNAELRKGEYGIIKRTSVAARKRSKNTKVILWLQGWRERDIAHKNFKRFIKNQIDSAKENGADGYIFWNAFSRYNELYSLHIENKKTMVAKI
jgi:hypothetical protein